MIVQDGFLYLIVTRNKLTVYNNYYYVSTDSFMILMFRCAKDLEISPRKQSKDT
jgi:hypothetical protein